MVLLKHHLKILYDVIGDMVMFKIKLKMNWPKTLNYAVVIVHLLSRVQLFATYELQNARLPCTSLSPCICSNSCALSQCCHATMSSFVAPFSSCRSVFPESWSSPVSQLFASGGQSVGDAASALPVNIQDWSPLGLTGLISLLFKGLSRVFSSTTVQSVNSLVLHFLYGPTLTSRHN